MIGALWKLYLPLVVLTAILALQNTKQAMLPARQTNVLWTCEIVVLACVLILRSGWARDARWRGAQAELGTIANNFYEPRREMISNSFAIGCAVFVSLWWAIATWAVVLNGFRGNTASRGLADFEVAALVGAIVGGVIGAVIGLVVGHVWETSHRRRRVAKLAS